MLTRDQVVGALKLLKVHAHPDPKEAIRQMAIADGHHEKSSSPFDQGADKILADIESYGPQWEAVKPKPNG